MIRLAESALTQVLGVEKMPAVAPKVKNTPLAYFQFMDNPNLQSVFANWKARDIVQAS